MPLHRLATLAAALLTALAATAWPLAPARAEAEATLDLNPAIEALQAASEPLEDDAVADLLEGKARLAPDQPADASSVDLWQRAGWGPLRDDDGRMDRIRAHRPERLPLADDALVPISLRLAWFSHWADLRAQASDFEGARETYSHAIALGAESVDNWRGLGRMRVHTGEYEAAEAAFLAALEIAENGAIVDDAQLCEIQRELGELYLAMDWPDDAVRKLRESLEIRPQATRAKQLLAIGLAAASGEVPAELAAQVELWPMPRSHHWRTRAESSLEDGLASIPTGARGFFDERVATLDSNGLLAGAGVLVLLWAGVRRFGKKADLVVGIEFPRELEGLFHVRLATRPGRFKRGNGKLEFDASLRKSTSMAHYGVSRETQFPRLRPKRYYVTLHGVLKNPDTHEVLAEAYEEQAIDTRGATAHRLAFDVSPRECPVDVKVCWDNRPATEIGVVARGLPQSLRYAATGNVRMRLPMGRHIVVVGSGDRIAECEVEVQTFQPTEFEIDLAGAENLVFKGCPPAVELYLHGDLNGAARALERDGHGNVAHLLLARLHKEQGHTERAAEQLESAGHTLEAAELRESMSDFQRAADLFLDSGDAQRAAETYRAAGDYATAGELFESLHDFASAAECFRESGAPDKLIGALERGGKFYEAADIALESGDRAASIRLLQQIGRGDPYYAEACEKLVDAFEREGHNDLAANKLEELIQARGAMNANGELRSRLAELLVEAEELPRALEVLEELRRREPTHPQIASRIEGLRKQISAQALGESGTRHETAPVMEGQQRYEIIEEIGRGGMGLIYRARDRRLDRIVALKRLPENLRDHPKALQLFLNEAQAAARLNHPNIVTVYDTDQEDGTFFITMELLEGLPLNTVLKQRGRLGPRDCARLGVQIATGLQYAHAQNVVHRDIKTANLFLTNDRIVKIMDFGLAKMMEEVRRGTTVIGGTPYYMAPEQAVGDRVDLRADLYSFGITLYELLTGVVPFRQGDVNYHHRHTAPADPRSVVEGIPDPLAELVLKLIQKSPDDRCTSATEVEQVLRGQI